jgi:type IV pilus assembly protein PilA
LAAIAIPAYQDYTIRAQVSEGLNLTGACKAAVTEYYQDRGDWPGNNDTAGLEAADKIIGKYTESVTVGLLGICQAKYGGGDVNTRIDGATLTMTPTNNDGSVSWECSGDAQLENKWLPSACRT